MACRRPTAASSLRLLTSTPASTSTTIARTWTPSPSSSFPLACSSPTLSFPASASPSTTSFVSVSSRSLTTSAPRHSHIGSLPILYPSTVTFSHPPPPHPSPASTHQSRLLEVSGPRGSLFVDLKPFVTLADSAASPLSPTSHTTASGSTPPPSSLSVTVDNPASKQQRAMWGLTRSLIHNAVVGVSEGYSLPLRLVGVGYRAAVEPVSSSSPNPAGTPSSSLASTQRLNLKLGYAHPVVMDLPPDVHADTPSTTTIILSGNDKQRLGQLAARIRRWRIPEPYNGKGIFVGDEVIRRKEVKKK